MKELRLTILSLLLLILGSCSTHDITQGRRTCDIEIKRINEDIIQDINKVSVDDIKYWVEYCSRYYDIAY